MGREIRKVPAGWEHPKETDPHDRRGMGYHPMHEQNFEEALKEWNEENDLWQAGQHPEQLSGDAEKYELGSYSEYAGDQPKQVDYAPYKADDCTHFQMYETVTEGTPVTPVFATLQQLEDWLVEKGELYGTKYCERFTREEAHAFCQSRWVPSAVGIPGVGIVTGMHSLNK